MATETPIRVMGVAASADTRALLRETVASALPRAVVELAEPDALEAARPPAVDCLVLDVDVTRAVDAVRQLRAGGFTGAIVVVGDERDELLAGRLAPLGALDLVSRRDLARALPDAVIAALGGGGDDPNGSAASLAALRADLRRTQRLVAAGEIALELQHAINNPLTALLAEAQLLELEPLSAEQQASVKRMVELCRRVIALVRRLDVVGGKAARP